MCIEDVALPPRRVEAPREDHLLIHAIHCVGIERVKRDSRAAPGLAAQVWVKVPGHRDLALKNLERDARVRNLPLNPHHRVIVVGRVGRRPCHPADSSRGGYDRGVEIKRICARAHCPSSLDCPPIRVDLVRTRNREGGLAFRVDLPEPDGHAECWHPELSALALEAPVTRVQAVCYIPPSIPATVGVARLRRQRGRARTDRYVRLPQ